MALEFDNSQHYGFFLSGTTLTSQTGHYVRMSELALSALRAAGVFSTMIDSTTAPATDKLWLDKNFDPAVLKEWDQTGSSWEPVTFTRLFNRAAVTSMATPTGTADALVVAAPSPFMNNRLYSLTPIADNTGATTIQVTGVGTYAATYLDGSALAEKEFRASRPTLLLFDGTAFRVVVAVADVFAARDEAQDILSQLQELYLGSFADDAAATSAAGGTPTEGQLYWNSTDDLVKAWDGAGWVAITEVPDGSVTTPKLANDVLSADAPGRAKMADGYVNTAKLANEALSADTSGRAKMSDGFLSADTEGRAKMADDYVNAAKIDGDDAEAIKTKLGIADSLEASSALAIRPNYLPTGSLSSAKVIGDASSGFHRHFGSIVRTADGKVRTFYRRAAGHASEFEGVICTRVLDHEGNELGSEVVIATNASGWDLQAPMAVVTPTGRIVVTCCHVSMTGVSVNLQSFYSDDNGDTWTSRTTFYSTTSARTYGQPRVVPSNVLGEKWMLLQPWYGRDSGGTLRRIGLWESHDDGATWTERSVPIYEGADLNLNETSIACLNARVWFAAIRRNSGRLHWSVTTDGGATWTSPTQVSWGTTLDVAPSLDIINVDGVDHLLLGYCDRSSDQTKWRWGKVSSLLTNAEVMGGLVAVTSPADMIEASGYQVPLIYPDGQMLYIEFRENAYNTTISDPVATTVRLVWANPRSWISGSTVFTATPTIAGKTTAGSPTYNTALMYVSKEPSGKVTLTGVLILSALGSMSGQLQIGGLPYTIRNNAAARGAFKIGYRNGVSLASAVEIFGLGNNNEKTVDLYINATTGVANFTNTQAASNLGLYFEYTYFTDD